MHSQAIKQNLSHYSLLDFFSKLLSCRKPSNNRLSSDKNPNQPPENHDHFPEKKNDLQYTQLQSLYDKVQSSNSSLTLQNHHKSQFLASVAHELKNQIGAIISLSEFIKSDNLEVIAELEDGKEEKTNQRSSSSSSKQKLIEAAELASDINNVASDLLEFARDLMDVHQAESGDFSVNMAEEIDIIHVIKRAIKVNYDFSLRRHITIEFDEAEARRNIPAVVNRLRLHDGVTAEKDRATTSTTPFPKIKLDQRRMKQILINLLSNSLKYSNERTRIRISLKVIAADQDFGQNISTPHQNISTPHQNISTPHQNISTPHPNPLPQGASSVKKTAQTAVFSEKGFAPVLGELPLPQGERVRVRGNESNNYLQITITDQGFGMTEEEIELALKKHQKIENENSEKFDSFGLGLHMVKRLVELQKGTLDIRSEAGKGSEFILRFPF